ncbi:MAG: hypothetical protein BWY24_00737 [Microgenomates group bacterium ADurb.Bin219]|nr:MAG: hypothetical protein BWY24_00737 [Microgenomates group bacterium ADurb.Bin219]
MKNKPYKNKEQLRQDYEMLGSTRQVGRFYGVTNVTVVNWMRRFQLPRIPKMYLYDNNSGWGRLAELYIQGHPYFKKQFKDLGEIDDKSKFDGLWHWDRVNIKCTHYKGKLTFRVKKKKHDVAYYICCVYVDEINPLIPNEIFVIPSKIAPRSGIGVTLEPKGKYHKYKLAHKRGVEFTIEEEVMYNEQFKMTYKCPSNK